MGDDTVKVLLVAGSGRSGSTLLSRALGSVEGVFWGGEILFLWDRGLQENRLCGCNRRFRDCDVWNDILTDAFGGIDKIDPGAHVAASRAGIRVRDVPQMLLSRRSPRFGPQPPSEYLDDLARLYRAIRDVTGCRLIVDSSKLPGYGLVLERVPGVDLSVVHLVRDPRAAAHSWLRQKPLPDRPGATHMEQHSALKSAVLWDLWNAMPPALWKRGRYLRYRYEDFVRNPRPALEEILDMVGMAGAKLPFSDERTLEAGVQHSVAGNPDRLEAGQVVFRGSGDRWAKELSRRDRLVVSAITSPLLVRYRYPLRVVAPAQKAGGGANGS